MVTRSQKYKLITNICTKRFYHYNLRCCHRSYTPHLPFCQPLIYVFTYCTLYIYFYRQLINIHYLIEFDYAVTVYYVTEYVNTTSWGAQGVGGAEE